MLRLTALLASPGLTSATISSTLVSLPGDTTSEDLATALVDVVDVARTCAQEVGRSGISRAAVESKLPTELLLQ
jgi:hypothetical protein